MAVFLTKIKEKYIMTNSINKTTDKIRLMLIDDHKLFRCGIKSLFDNDL